MYLNNEFINHSSNNTGYIGIIIEESLDDNRLINGLDIRKLHITNNPDPLKRVHMYEVHVSRYEIQELSKHIIDNWYMHFWKGRDVIAAFKGISFELNYDDKATWEKVLIYGRALGLLDEQLGFSISGL
jgi:hypothetical protein